MNWQDLNLSEKSELMKLYIQNGITSLSAMKEHYNNFQAGGPKESKEKEPNFVTRLKQGNSRKGIIDNEGNPASHKLSVADHRVYPEVQEDEKGNLRDYGAIPYRPFYAYDRAVENKDYVEFPDDESAVNFTEHYKDAAIYPWYGTFDNYFPWRYSKGGNLKQEGGPTNNKSDWAKAHETELVLHQLGWDNPDNRLHSDYAARDDNGYYAGYNLKPVTIRPSIQQQLRDLGKNNPKAYGIVEQFDPEAVKFNNQWGLGLWAILAGAKAPELIKDATVKGFETLNKVYNPTKWHGAGLTAVTAAKPLVDLTSTSNYTDENGKYNTGNAWNNINNWTTDAVFASPAFNAGKQGVKAVTDAFKYNTTLGRNMTIANELRKGINGSTLTTAPVENAVHNRFRLGDVELGDPFIAYRQGSQSMIDDFLSTGVVRSDGLGATAMHPKVEGKISLSKNFSNPMFRQGNLWYGIPEDGSARVGLLTTREPLQVATKTSASNRSYLDIAGTSDTQTFGLDQGRRIPISKTQLNLENTTPYLFDSNYGYRRMQEPIPTLEQAYQEADWFKQLSSPILQLPENTSIRPQIKPLIKGAEIEKQLSKTGTISRKSLDAYINKQGKYYQEVMNEVLDSEFKDIDKINYYEFKNAVRKKLPEYSRIPQIEFEDYGVTRLGFEERVPEVFSTFFHRYVPIRERDYPSNLNTFTFESPGIIGNTKHYKGNPLGHSRTYTTKEEPNVLHVMESQSDWAQAPKGATSTEKRQLEQFNRLIEDTENLIKQKDELGIDVAAEREDLKDLLEEKDFVEKNIALRKGTNIEELMKDTYTERQIQENLKYAAEKGQSKMRYPTRETAAKIEGYPSENYGEYYDVKRELQDVDNYLWGLEHPPVGPVDITRNTPEQIAERATKTRKHIEEIMQSEQYKLVAKKAKELRQKLEEVKDKKYVRYNPEHETILKKYDNFPKQFQKLFGKKAEVRTVTDKKGNTWYEVDVPESYKNKTGQIIFSAGGLLSLEGLQNNN